MKRFLRRNCWRANSSFAQRIYFVCWHAASEQGFGGDTYLFLSLFRFLFNLILFVFMFLGTVILSANSRNNEYQADEFAHQIGYGEELIESLYLLQKMSLGEEMALVERMTASHPLLAKRIGRLEMLQEQESDESTDTE